MEFYSFLPIFLVFFTAWAVCGIAGFSPVAVDVPERQSSLDGLRGYLAIAVFLHHASFHFEFSKTGLWVAPSSNLYAQLGDSSVKLFFMITGFLFFSKLLRAKETGRMEWLHLFVGRFCRIVPLYWIAVLSMFLVVFIRSDFEVREPVLYLFLKVLNWLNFIFTTQPDLNGVLGSKLILAGVIWTLGVEWMFYLFLPVAAVLIGMRVDRPFLVISIIPIVWAAVFIGFKTQSTLIALVPFLGGIIAAYINRISSIALWMRGRFASILVLIALTLNVIFMPNGHNFITPIFLAIAFVPIACGNTIFGSLRWGFAKYLGDISYSIYLMHGLLLYVVFEFIVDRAYMLVMTPQVYWSIVIALVPVLLVLCTFTYRQVENRGMNAAPCFLNKLRRFKFFGKYFPAVRQF